MLVLVALVINLRLPSLDDPRCVMQFSLHVQELDVVRNSMKAWESNLSMPVGIDIFWEEHRRGYAAPRRELLERWEIVYVGDKF